MRQACPRCCLGRDLCHSPRQVIMAAALLLTSDFVPIANWCALSFSLHVLLVCMTFSHASRPLQLSRLCRLFSFCVPVAVSSLRECFTLLARRSRSVVRHAGMSVFFVSVTAYISIHRIKHHHMYHFTQSRNRKRVLSVSVLQNGNCTTVIRVQVCGERDHGARCTI